MGVSASTVVTVVLAALLLLVAVLLTVFGWRPRRALALVAVLLLGAVGGYAWASSRGYVPPVTGYGCSDVGYLPPLPSYEELTDQGVAPYCARRVRDETWF